MVDSARLGAVVDKGTAGASELVVEGDRGGQAAEPVQDAFAQALEGAGAVAFEGEDVFAGPEGLVSTSVGHLRRPVASRQAIKASNLSQWSIGFRTRLFGRARRLGRVREQRRQLRATPPSARPER
jgi:hypothetical protein